MILSPQQRAELVQHLMHLPPTELLLVTQNLADAMAERQNRLRQQTAEEIRQLDVEWEQFNGRQ